MFLKQKQEENIVKEDKNYYIVDKAVLPEIFLKVMDVKNLLESKKEKTVQDAVTCFFLLALKNLFKSKTV